jgi:hypothetical protein
VCLKKKVKSTNLLTSLFFFNSFVEITGLNDDFFSTIISNASSLHDIHHNDLDRHLLLEEKAENEGKCSMRQRIICMTQSLLETIELVPSL